MKFARRSSKRIASAGFCIVLFLFLSIGSSIGKTGGGEGICIHWIADAVGLPCNEAGKGCGFRDIDRKKAAAMITIEA